MAHLLKCAANLKRGYAPSFTFSCSLDYKILSSSVVCRLKFYLGFRALMYIVRVSSLLLTPLQALF